MTRRRRIAIIAVLAVVVVAGAYVCHYLWHFSRLFFNYDMGTFGDFSEGRARVLVSDKWGYIDRGGNMVIKPEFDRVWCREGGLVQVTLDDKIGWTDRHGNWVWEPTE